MLVLDFSPQPSQGNVTFETEANPDSIPVTELVIRIRDDSFPFEVEMLRVIKTICS